MQLLSADWAAAEDTTRRIAAWGLAFTAASFAAYLILELLAERISARFRSACVDCRLDFTYHDRHMFFRTIKSRPL